MTFNSFDHTLERFVDAQAPVYKSVVGELSGGKKTTHWMWFIFPQLKELGRSPIAKYYGLASVDEALAYWQHPILGKRLIECTQLVMAARSTAIHAIFSSPDDLKFQSCMTLLAWVAPDEPVFRTALVHFFDRLPDQNTLRLLKLKN